MFNDLVVDVILVTLLEDVPKLLAVITLVNGGVVLLTDVAVETTDEIGALADEIVGLVSSTLVDPDDEVALNDTGAEYDVVETDVDVKPREGVVSFGK